MNTIETTPGKIRLIASAKSWIEGEALRQLFATAKLEGMRLAVGLPDLHPDRGHPVGAAFVTEGMIYAYLVGNDIGCGMALFKTDLLRRKAKLDRWTDRLHDLEHPWEGDVRERLAEVGLASTRFDSALGTIGGGNHFAELQAVEKIFDAEEFTRLGLEKENLVLVGLVHSGSRGLGDSILRAYIDEHRSAGVLASSEAAAEYLRGHDLALRWAKAHRALIAERFLAALGAEGERVWDGCHNSVTHRSTNSEAADVLPASCRQSEPSRKDVGSTLWIHRKGAAPANNGAIVIPGSRGALSYLVLPVGDQAANGWSLAHGAGRKWTRSESRARARERFRHDELVQTGLGSHVICEDRNLLYEEAPSALQKNRGSDSGPHRCRTHPRHRDVAFPHHLQDAQSASLSSKPQASSSREAPSAKNQ